MIRALGIGALIILAVIAAGFIAQRLFGSHDDHPMSEAQEAIETLAFAAAAGEISEGVLVGSLRGRSQIVHIVVSDSRRTPEVVAGARGWATAPGHAGPFWIWDDSESDRWPQTKVAREARADDLTELEQALRRLNR